MYAFRWRIAEGERSNLAEFLSNGPPGDVLLTPAGEFVRPDLQATYDQAPSYVSVTLVAEENPDGRRT